MAELSKQLCNILCNDEKAIEEVKKIRDRLSLISGKSSTEMENILIRTLLPELKPLKLSPKKYDISYDGSANEETSCSSTKVEASLKCEDIVEMFKRFKEYEPKPFFSVELTEKDIEQSRMSARLRFGVPMLSDYETIRKPCRRHKKRRINKKLVKKYGLKWVEFKRKRVPMIFSTCMA